MRRKFLCELLGLGYSDNKPLLQQLNLYGFEREAVNSALNISNILVEEWTKSPWLSRY